MTERHDRIAIFEDEHSSNFAPIALLRPVFDLRCGHFTLIERIQTLLAPSELGAFIRSELVAVSKEQHPALHVNDSSWIESESILLVNARWIGELSDNEQFGPNAAGWIGTELAWVFAEKGELGLTSVSEIASELKQLAKSKKAVEANGIMVHYPWDLVHHNAKQLTIDFRSREASTSQDLNSHIGVVGDKDDIHLSPSADIDPFVVLDSRHGPIWIEEGAKIQAFTRIEGPAYIGHDTQTFRANIREGTSIGPVCRVGGEVEESILHGYVNKYHDGFLGHSYVCPWVNLGALTTNSDLKNDYSNVSIPLSGESIRSDSNKVGCFIGDHTKTAICSLLNTGTSVGVMAMLLPGGELMPKHVPSFSRIWHGAVEELPDGTTSAIKTARIAMSRRGEELTEAMETLLASVFEKTTEERQSAIARSHSRK